MSNDKHAYGWSGHILARESEYDEKALQENVVFLNDKLFDKIYYDFLNSNIPYGIQIELLGLICREKLNFMASGSGFTKAFRFYGSPFIQAECRSKEPIIINNDIEYLSSMRSQYGIDIPPCRLMIGCSFEM